MQSSGSKHSLNYFFFGCIKYPNVVISWPFHLLYACYLQRDEVVGRKRWHFQFTLETALRLTVSVYSLLCLCVVCDHLLPRYLRKMNLHSYLILTHYSHLRMNLSLRNASNSTKFAASLESIRNGQF